MAARDAMPAVPVGENTEGSPDTTPDTTPEQPVSSIKRKLKDALSPESLRMEDEVSEKTTTNSPMHKKRYLVYRKGKGVRPRNISRIYKTKQPIPKTKTKSKNQEDI